MDKMACLKQAKLATLAMQRYSWEQGIVAQAFLEQGDRDVVIAMAKEAQNRQTAAPEAGAQRFCMYCGTPLDENGQCPNCKK